MTIVTDLDRKRVRELRMYLVGMCLAAALFGAALAWFQEAQFGLVLRGVALLIPICIIVFCLWRFDSITNCSSYCPDEPLPKD